MCGIVGYLNLRNDEPPSALMLRQMLAMIRHRGPDQFGIYLGEEIGMGNARLSIVDLASGQQPIGSEDERFWIVYNGEICEASSRKKATDLKPTVILKSFFISLSRKVPGVSVASTANLPLRSGTRPSVSCLSRATGWESDPFSTIRVTGCSRSVPR